MAQLYQAGRNQYFPGRNYLTNSRPSSRLVINGCVAMIVLFQGKAYFEGNK